MAGGHRAGQMRRQAARPWASWPIATRHIQPAAFAAASHASSARMMKKRRAGERTGGQGWQGSSGQARGRVPGKGRAGKRRAAETVEVRERAVGRLGELAGARAGELTKGLALAVDRKQIIC